MRRLRTTFASLALATMILSAHETRAQTRTPTTAEMQEAEARFQEGLAHYSKGQINEARVKLVQAYAVLGRTNILWNLSVAEFYSSRLLESIRHMRHFVRSPDADKNDVKIALEKFIPAIEKQTARIKIEAPRGTSLSIDGQELGIAPLEDPVDVLPGKHQVVAQGERGTMGVVVVPDAGQTVTAKVGDSEADGASSGQSRSNGAATGAEREAPSSPARVITSAALLGSAVVAAGVGLVFVGVASGHSSTAKDLTAQLGGDPSACSGSPRPECSQLHDENRARDTDQGIATGFFIGAGVLAVGAVATYLLWPNDSGNKARGHVVPIVGPQMAGGAFVTNF